MPIDLRDMTGLRGVWRAPKIAGKIESMPKGRKDLVLIISLKFL